MKHFSDFAIMSAILLGISIPMARAATLSSPLFNAKAVVSGETTMTVVLRKNDFQGAEVQSMDFGTLVEKTFTDPNNPAKVYKSLRSDTTGSTGTAAILAWITANTHGNPYVVSQSGTALTNGGNMIPAGCCTVVPVYNATDNGGAAQPGGSKVGDKGTWVMPDKPLYTSESGSAQMRTISCFYSITDDPATGATAACPIGQPVGIYSGTVTFTVTS